MNRTEYMRAVYATDLDHVSKSILVYLGFCKNWKSDTLAFPSHARIAADTGLGLRTVKRKVPMLRAQGYLTDTGVRKGRGVIAYDLTDPTSATAAPQECQRGTVQSHSGTAGVPERHTEQVREQVQEPVSELVHTAPVADAPVSADSSASLQREAREDSGPTMGDIWVSENGDVLFEADTGSGVYLLSESGVDALPLSGTRTAAPSRHRSQLEAERRERERQAALSDTYGQNYLAGDW